ncbi:MAG TPA: RNA polymerase sigma factor [Methylomirabilota bacterium]|nr:RNA polymerase sigma factor [Methylomirabilota bacterium]
MGIAGLALAWETRIFSVNSNQSSQERRVESSGSSATALNSSGAVAAEDAALAAACRAGDLSAYERLYALHGSRMKSLARQLLGSQLDAEDAVQETFLKIQRAISSYRGQSAFSTWAFRILVNSCYDLRRRRGRRREVPDTPSEGHDPLPEPRGPCAHPALRLALERSLAKLPDRQREIFLLYEVEGFAHAEIAAMLGVSEAVSKNTLFQAKKALRQMLEPPRSTGRPD